MEQPGRTVLIVDDDPQILRLVEKMLRAKPFKILSARTPSEALQICQREPVDLLISDISMPEMDGNKLVIKVRELRPETAVLLISGRYREMPAEDGGSRPGGISGEAVLSVGSAAGDEGVAAGSVGWVRRWTSLERLQPKI